MSPAKNPEKPSKPKAGTPRISKTAKQTASVSPIETQPKCHIHDEVLDFEVDEIHENVCVNDEALTEFEGKHYCLFHLPTKEKDVKKFETIFRARLAEVEKSIAAIEELPEDERKKAKGKISYNFRYVWFPSFVGLFRYKFSAVADFNSATFSSDADFRSATFSSDADFMSVTFSAVASFILATFSSDADFRSTTFSADAYFMSATFSAVAYFSEAIFSDTSKIYFINTKFCADVEFYEAVFEGYVEFEGEVFLDNAQVLEIKKQLQNDEIRENQEAFLSLEKARLNKPDRISFNSMKLRPCWFVNAEVRNLVFNDVEWQNLEIDVDKSGLDREFDKLTERHVSRPKESLIKACNQLADNAEANRRFEEAKQFRKQDIALRGYKCHIQDAVESGDKDEIRRSVCQKYPVVNEDGGNYYCLLHNPDKNKAEIFLPEFEKLRKAKYSDYRAVNFPISLRFYDKLPEKMNFSHAIFQRKVVFHEAEINKLDFDVAHFNEDAELVFEYSFCNGNVSFEKTVFDGKFFLNGMSDYDFFKNPKRALSLKDARFEKPQSVNFRSVRLRPHYFVGVDASKFVFHDCQWKDENGKKLDIKAEIRLCSNKELAQTTNQIAINYEENRNFEESTTFRYLAMQAKRFESRLHGWFWTLNWLYWWSSGYGERRWRAAVNLVLVLVLFGALYASPLSSFDYGEKSMEKSAEIVENQIFCCAGYGERFHAMRVAEGFVHSLSVAAFQRPEPKPADTPTKFFVFLETILAPLQAALLALAIRRKFMR